MPTFPLERAYTAVDDGPIRPQAFNQVQDAIRDNKHGSVKIPIPIHWARHADAYSSGGFTLSDDYIDIATPGAVTTMLFGLGRLPLGTRITEALVYVETKSGAGNVTLDLVSSVRTGISGLTRATGTRTTVGELAITPTAPGYTTIEDENMKLRLQVPDESVHITYVEITVEFP